MKASHITIEESANGVSFLVAKRTQYKEMYDVNAHVDAAVHNEWKAVIGEDSQITLYEDQIRASEIIVESGAQLTLICVQDSASDATETLNKKIILGENARATVYSLLLDSIDLSMAAELKGQNAEYEYQCVYVGQNRAAIRLHTDALHNGKNTLSTTRIRGIALDNSHIQFSGNITVAESGSTHGSSLEHEGLLMSKRARIDALPGLEVATNEVKAAHSSAVHYIRPEQLFYLASRGIAEYDAKQLIIHGFLEEVIAPIPYAPIRTILIERLTPHQY